MCLVVVAWRLHPSEDLIVAANRDESHGRATAPMDRWADLPGVAAGRDLVAGGTWLGVDARGRFACVTNYRGEPNRSATTHSRGRLVSAFLGSDMPAGEYLDTLARDATGYPGFNLLVADGESLWYASNRTERFARCLPPGVHGLSNDLLDVPWPKVQRCKQGLRAALDTGDSSPPRLFALLAERSPDLEAPPPGLPWPASSGPFIVHDSYGTRTSTVVLRRPGSTWIGEQRFGPNGRPEGSDTLNIRHSTLNGG